LRVGLRAIAAVYSPSTPEIESSRPRCRGGGLTPPLALSAVGRRSAEVRGAFRQLRIRVGEHVPDLIRLLLGRRRPVCVGPRQPVEAALDRVARHPLSERNGLLQRSQRGPERRFDLARLVGQEARVAVGVTDVAAEAEQPAFGDVPERPPALRARDARRRKPVDPLAQPVAAALCGVAQGGHPRREGGLALPASGARGNRVRNLFDREHLVDFDAAHRRERHARERRLLGLLHQGEAAHPLDLEEAPGPVVERAGEHDPDHARAIARGRGAEQRVDRGTKAVLARAVRQPKPAPVHEEMRVGRGDDDLAVADALPVLGERRRQLADPRDQLREEAWLLARRVDHDEDRRGEVPRQPARHAAERFESTGRAPDHDDVAGGRSHVGRRVQHAGRAQIAGTASARSAVVQRDRSTRTGTRIPEIRHTAVTADLAVCSKNRVARRGKRSPRVPRRHGL
jgi:hypothetical protein